MEFLLSKKIDYNGALPKHIKFGLFLSFEIPSILCHIFVIFHLLRDRDLGKALHNHVILVILILNFFLITIDLSIVLDFLYIGFVRGNILQKCQAWNFLDSILSNSSSFLMLWASIERHIIIFHDRQFHNTQFKRFVLHYVPLSLILTYTIGFYVGAIFFYPYCSNEAHFEYDTMFCGKACYVHEDLDLSVYELLVHRILPSILIFFFSFALLARILISKLRRKQRIRWRQQQKMTIQFLSISILYFIGTLPAGIGELLHVLSGEREDGHESELQEDIFLYLFYFVSLMLPFVCLMSLPEIYMKLLVLLHLKRPNRVAIVPSVECGNRA